MLYCEIWSYLKLKNIVYFLGYSKEKKIWQPAYFMLFSTKYKLFNLKIHRNLFQIY